MPIAQDYELLDVDLLDPHPGNYNEGDVDAIRESIQTNDWYGTVTVRELEGRYQILAGEHRWRAAKLEGEPQVPCVIQTDCDDLRAARIVIADNMTARRAVVHTDKLSALVQQIGSIEGTGIDLSDLADFEDQRAEEEAEQERAQEEADRDDEEEEREFAREYGLVLTFDTETEQEEAYNALRELGYERIRVASI